MYVLYFNKEPGIKLYLVSYDKILKLLKFTTQLDSTCLHYQSREIALEYSLLIQKYFSIILSIEKVG